MTKEIVQKIERALFTLAILIALIIAQGISRAWPLRASIIILILGGAGLVLALSQLFLDLMPRTRAADRSEGPIFDVPPIDPGTRWGNLEIWGWILGFYGVIHLIGFPAAVPLFVFAYAKLYGARWGLALVLAVLAWAFLYALFEQILHVPWPKPLLPSFFWS